MAHLRLIRLLRASTGMTDADIARVLGIPRASVRRLVRDIRSYGISVSLLHGFYTLGKG